MLAMTGRVTMLGISRWAGEGGSYRTVQRLFNTVIAWGNVQWFFIRHHLLDPGDRILIAGDESVVTKSGHKTFGLDRFFSSLYGKAVPGIAFFGLSLISVKHRVSHPVMMEQVIKAKPEKQEPKPSKSAKKQDQKKRPPGRPKGSKNRNRRDVELSPYLLQIQGMLHRLLRLVGAEIQPIYCVLDGAFGNNYALQMVRQCSLHLISKLRCDAALYFPYQGPQKKFGPRRKYGDKLNYAHISDQSLQASSVEDGIQTRIYQMLMWHKLFADPLNVVIVVKTNLKTRARARVVLFSSDLDLAYDQLIDYYRLRFQIEFNFRDAKQFWGLEDFMNVKPIPLHNGANLAMFMVNLSRALIRHFRPACPTFSVIDLKAHFRGRKYVIETLKHLPQKPEPISIDHLFARVLAIGSVNATFNSS
jgi:hypothetical protein